MTHIANSTPTVDFDEITALTDKQHHRLPSKDQMDWEDITASLSNSEIIMALEEDTMSIGTVSSVNSEIAVAISPGSISSSISSLSESIPSEVVASTQPPSTRTNSTSTPSVRFNNLVDCLYIPSLSSLSEECKEDLFMTEKDYERSTKAFVRDVQCMLETEDRYQQQHHNQKRDQQKRSYQKSPPPLNKELCFLGLEAATPKGRSLRDYLQQTSKHTVCQEQHVQRTSSGGNQPLDDDRLASVYMPFAMQAQTSAYQRAITTAMELGNFEMSSIPQEENEEQQQQQH